ncbi:FAD-dependent oxidoreductase [Sorangium sp. So ce1151]|uniref:FAD-dependent oxidoreductase n=1 Tax=Sorangium sp. So ce1151 TaxID=3133332 RepID=UPI003F602C32
MNRRGFLSSVAAGWLVHTAAPGRPPLAGQVVGAAHGAGHLLRGGTPRAPTMTTSGPAERADVVIVGGGVSGLSAAWRLAGAGLDLRVLELEPRPGGTSAWGEDGVVPYPWGAHYLAAPNVEARATLRLLEQMGVVTGWDAAGRPTFDPRRLCHAPGERLFYEGAWHAGLAPVDALPADALEELERFHALEEELTELTGRDGRAAFQIPLARSSRDPELLELDRMSMSAWLDREGYRTPFLRWYVRYAMLDDFGGEPEEISAWAGLHYFAGRKVRTPELAGSHYLIWPEGNGRLVKALLERAAPRVSLGALVTSVRSRPEGGVEVGYIDVQRGEARRVEARAAILAAPAFVVRRLLAGGASGELPERTASAWLVANLHVERPIDPNHAWDSVLYGAEGLGYVDARHQLTDLAAATTQRSRLATPVQRTVLTYYRAFGGPDVAAARAALLGAPWASLADGVLRDLAPAHPHLRDDVERMDVMIWGHAMPRPRPGFLGARPFEPPCALAERVAWAHVDQPGMALFEEAQACGVRAAETIAAELEVAIGESWL